MAIDAVNSVTTSAAEPMGKVNETSLGKDDFLRLLIAQLQSQDPLNPLEGAEFTAQLAQFSSLEQLQNVNDQLDRLHNDQIQSMKQMAVSMIGKTIKIAGNEFNLVNGQSEEMVFELGEKAENVIISIYDDGQLVNRLSFQELAAGEHRKRWDGADLSGAPKDPGRYAYEIEAFDKNGHIIHDVKSFVAGTVTGVSFTDETAKVLMEAHKVPLDKILKVTTTKNIGAINQPNTTDGGEE
jgi:flagellar basal-body rod modification protein FlgD